MNQIAQQIRIAQRRLFWTNLLRSLGISLFVGLTIAVIGMAVPKLWHLSILQESNTNQIWAWSWIGGGLLAGLIFGVLSTLITTADSEATAIEIDQRFGLKDRISSALSLTERQRNSDIGSALINDAKSKAEMIEISEKFPVTPHRRMLLPLLPLVLLGTLVIVPNAEAKKPTTPEVEENKIDVKSVVEETKKKLQAKAQQMEAKGLKDAAEDLNSLSKKIDSLSNERDGGKRDALVKLNNVKKEIEDRQKQIGGNSSEFKRQLNQMKKINDGPANKISEAINEGQFKEAKEAVRQLLNDLKNGKLSESQKRKLARDLKKIADEMKKMSQKHEEAKKQLKEKLQKANQEGNLEKAAQLQQKLNEMQKQDKQMQKMQKMADSLKKCANCMKQGNGQKKQGQKSPNSPGQSGNQPSDADMQDAMDSLEDLESMLEDLETDMDQLQDLEDMMNQIETAKGNCNGCQGSKADQPRWQDWAKGGGRGAGKRDKQETDTGFFKSRVKGKLMSGETVVTGNADGKNISGKSISEVQAIAKSSMNEKSDPLENQKLPRFQRDHAKEYFDSLRNQ